MANTQSVSNSFKVELMNGIHALGATVARVGTTKDDFKAALFLASATLDEDTTAYSVTGEASGTNYVAGGVAVTNAGAPALDGSTAHWTPSADFSWINVTLSNAFDAVQIYNSTQGDKSVAVYTFGSQTVTGGNFTLTMPASDGTTGLLRLD